MWLNMCPRCEGDLYIRPELDGTDLVCIQCGYIDYDVPDERPAMAASVTRQPVRNPDATPLAA